MDCSTSDFPVLHYLLGIAQTHVHLFGDTIHHFILCHLLPLLPSIFPSISIFSNEWALRIRWLKYWSFSLSISPSREYSGMISLKIHWFDLLAVQGTLGSLLKHHSLMVPVLRCSIFFPVQLSQLYMTRGKTIALTIPTFVGRVMSLLLNMLSRLVITFFPRSKCLLISWLQSPSASKYSINLVLDFVSWSSGSSLKKWRKYMLTVLIKNKTDRNYISMFVMRK